MTIRMDTLRSKITLKIIIVGDQGVGKTCLLKRYMESKFNIQEKATIGADFITKRVKVKGYNTILQIWDTAGLERFSNLNKSFYRGSDGVIIVYDVTVKETYDNILVWREKFLEIQDNFDLCNFTICGNKNDSGSEAFFDYENPEIKKLKQQGLKFYQVSAKSGKGVNKLFNNVAERAIEKYMNENVYDQEIGEIFKEEVRSSVLLPEETPKTKTPLEKMCGC